MMFGINKSSTRYYSVQTVNKTDGPLKLFFQDTRAQDLIQNVDKYEVSILRFSLDCSEIPLMIFPNAGFDTFQQPPYNGVDNDAYSITMEDGAGNIQRADVEYLADGKGSMPYIYSFDRFVEMLNLAILTASTALETTAGKNPFFVYNKATASIDFVAPEGFRDGTVGGRKFFVNKALFDLFAKDYNGQVLDESFGRYFRLSVAPTGFNDVTITKAYANGVEIADDYAGYRMETYFPNLGSLIACRSLVFTTTSLPVVEEHTVFNLEMNNNTSNDIIRIIKDFEFNLQDSAAIYTRGLQNFSIASEFQMIEMKSGGEPLKNIDIIGFWRDRHGQLHELFIPEGSTFTMKFLFRHK
jgi:hypothetical protein